LMAGLAIDSQNRIIAVDQMPARIEVFHYISDAEAAAANQGHKAPEMGSKTAAPAKAAQGAQPAASSGPTVEELQKQLADLKAKLAAQQSQKPDDAGKGGAEPANKPAQEVPSSPH